MTRLLSDRDTYLPLASNPTIKFKKELQALIDKGFEQGILNKKRKSIPDSLCPEGPSYVLLAQNT